MHRISLFMVFSPLSGGTISESPLPPGASLQNLGLTSLLTDNTLRNYLV
jgi:hypothetical protein